MRSYNSMRGLFYRPWHSFIILLVFCVLFIGNITSNCAYFYILCLYHKIKLNETNNEIKLKINRKRHSLKIKRYLKKLNEISSEILESNKFWNKFFLIFYFCFILMICVLLYPLLLGKIFFILRATFCIGFIILFLLQQ